MATLRDLFLTQILSEMHKRDDVFFLTADFGAPALDQLKADFPDRYINVGVAEQNMINTAVGLAKEGATVFCFAIAPFVTMRCFEQLRTCISVFGKYTPLNINLIGVGAGVSYDMSGPTHHCFEDLAITNMLPRFDVFSPSDGTLIEKAFQHSMNCSSPMYLRFDSKALPLLSQFDADWEFSDGFRIIEESQNSSLLISTGYATHVALSAVAEVSHGIDVVDVFCLGNDFKPGLSHKLKKYDSVCCLYEGFKWAGGLDTYVLECADIGRLKNFESLGFSDYCFALGKRELLWQEGGVSEDHIRKVLENFS